jgi:hypothetical protein
MSTKKEERINKLCSGFSRLDDRDQEYIFGVLQALLFAEKKVKKDTATFLSPHSEAERIENNEK